MKKEKSLSYFFSFIIVVIDTISFIVFWMLFSENGSIETISFVTYILLFITFVCVLIFFATMYDSFAITRRRFLENAYSITLSGFLSAFLFYFLETLAFRKIYNPLYIIMFVVFSFIINILLFYFASVCIFKVIVPKKTIIYYSREYDLKVITGVPYFEKKYEVISTLLNPTYNNLRYDCDVIFMIGIDHQVRNKVINECVNNEIEVFIFPDIVDILIKGGEHIEDMVSPMIHIKKLKTSFFYSMLKRFFDIMLSSFSLVLFAPIFFIIAFIIKCYDGGPVFYLQKRLTKNGKIFTIYKFRSMSVNAEADGIARLSTKNDKRITPIGKFIRALRLDELPQLFNILKGDMSIVGPRPERPEIAEKYANTIPEFKYRLKVKAGLTGYAQVYGKYNSNPLDKLIMDLYYINNCSLLFDLKICLMTIKIIFMKESTEAFDNVGSDR